MECPAAFDVTVISTMQKSNVQKSTSRHGRVLGRSYSAFLLSRICTCIYLCIIASECGGVECAHLAVYTHCEIIYCYAYLELHDGAALTKIDKYRVKILNGMVTLD